MPSENLAPAGLVHMLSRRPQSRKWGFCSSWAIRSSVGSRAGAVVREVVALSVSRVSPFVPV